MAVIRTKTGIDRLKQMLKEIEAKQVQVGWFETSKYEDGTPVAYVATIQEFGHGAIPARPFMRPTMQQQREEWKNTLKKGFRRVVNDQMEAEEMLLAFGLSAAGDVASSIEAVTAPPLSQVTLEARQSKKKTEGVSKKPLVDTGQMIQSVTAQVSDR